MSNECCGEITSKELRGVEILIIVVKTFDTKIYITW